MNTRDKALSIVCEEEFLEYLERYFEIAYELTKEIQKVYLQLRAEPKEDIDERNRLWSKIREIENTKKEVFKAFFKDSFDDDIEEDFYDNYIKYYILGKRLEDKIRKVYLELKSTEKNDYEKRRALKEELRALQQKQKQNQSDFAGDAFDFLSWMRNDIYGSTTAEECYYIWPDSGYTEMWIDEMEQQLISLYNREKLLDEEIKKVERLERMLLFLENEESCDEINFPLFGCSKERLLGGKNNG